jgi:hypothetical protein
LSLFFIEIDKENPLIDKFIEETNNKAVLLISQKLKRFEEVVLVDLSFGVPPIFLLGFVLLPIGIFFWKPMLFISAFFFLTYFFFWDYFHFWALKKGLKKYGYTGDISKLHNVDAIRRVLL